MSKREHLETTLRKALEELPVVTAFLDRPERSDRAGEILPERLVAQIPGLLLAETAELLGDLPRSYALAGERVLELLERRDQLTGLGAECLDEGTSPRDHQIELACLGPCHEPRLQLLAGDVDLADLTDRLHELLEPRGDLPT